MRLPLGFYVPCLAAIVIAMAVVHKTAVWERHHTARFPIGVDLIPPSNAASNKYDPGQWEHQARERRSASSTGRSGSRSLLRSSWSSLYVP